MARANDTRQTIKVAADKEKLRNGPTFDDEREITPEFEKEVYSYYGLHRASTTQRAPPTEPTMPSRAPRRRVWPVPPT